jgi:hypothetical protein
MLGREEEVQEILEIPGVRRHSLLMKEGLKNLLERG